MSSEPLAVPDGLEDAAEIFLKLRPRLFGIAYRMLGTVVEAEDLVQDTWLRWQATDRSVVLDPPAFLATTITRLAINLIQSARANRETYIGPWLPEPVDTRNDPYLGAERGEALKFAVLVLLEKLSPTERAAYVLREAFDFSYRTIGEMLQLSEANARQLAARARKGISKDRREVASPSRQRELLEVFIAAAQKGDLAGLQDLFAAEIVSYSDGGGAATAARLPVVGRERVARFISAFAPHFWINTKLEWVQANGQASVLISRAEELLALATVDASSQGIEQILWIMNPAKLKTITRS